MWTSLSISHMDVSHAKVLMSTTSSDYLITVLCLSMKHGNNQCSDKCSIWASCAGIIIVMTHVLRNYVATQSK